MGFHLPDDYQPGDWMWTDANLPEGKRTLDKAWDIIYKIPNWWESLEPTTDVTDLVKWFSENSGKNDIYFVTARPDGAGRSARDQSVRWLSNQMWQPITSPIHVIPVRTGMCKRDVIRSLEIDYSIDDNTPNVVSNKSVRGHKAYLLNRSWNRDAKGYGLNTVDTLQEFFEKIGSNH